jgi:hypothetical protein
MQGNKQRNFETLKEILIKQPNSKFAYFRRLGEGFKGDIIDVPIRQSEFMIKQFPMWELVQAIEQIRDDIAALFNDTEEIKPSEFKQEEILEVPPIPEPMSDEEFETIMSEDTVPDSEQMVEKTAKKTKRNHRTVVKRVR